MSTLSPPPYTRLIGTATVAGKQVPVTGDISWLRYWAQGVYDRIGGATGASNAELAALIAALELSIDTLDSAVDDLTIEVDSLGASVDAINSSVAAIQSDVSDLQARVAALEAELMPKALEYDYIDATTSYRGEADPGSATSDAAWRIQRITITGDDIAIQWADGTSAQTQIWDDRLSLSYS